MKTLYVRLFETGMLTSIVTCITILTSQAGGKLPGATLMSPSSSPVFSVSKYSYTPKETAPLGATIGQVKATDADGDILKYSIEAGNTNQTFTIDQSTGQLFLAKALNHHLQSIFRLKIRSTDTNSQWSEVPVDISVIPVDSVASFQNLNWGTATNQPMGTHEVHGEVVHNKLYIFGGYNPARRPAYIPTKKAFVYDPVGNKWTAIADLPHVPNGTDFGGVTHEGLTTDGTDIYIAGGYISNSTGSGQVFGTKQVYRYNVASDTYTAMPPLPESLASGQLMYVKGKLHFMGGANMSRNDVAVHYMLDLDNLPAGWNALAPLTNPRNHGGSTVFDGKIYFIGGAHGHDAGAVAQSTVEYYDEIANTWHVVADLPVPRDHISSSVIVAGDRILVLGGKRTHTSVLDLVSAYDPVLDKWEDITPLNYPISSGVAAFLNNKVIYTGGAFTSTNRQGSLPNATTSQKVEDLLLINADNGTVIRSIADNDIINLAALNVKNVNIEAVTSPGKVGSVVFHLSGTESKDVTESLAPYALFGDNKAGTYNPWAPGIGDYILSATPFASSGGTGSKGIGLTKSFSITNDQVLTFNIEPVADAYVRDGSYADRNYGTETELVVKGSSNQNFSRYAYLKFELGSITAVSSAKLRIYGSNASTSTSITVKAFGSSNNSWNEQTITFNNQPSSSANALSQVQVTGQPDYFDLDVTDFVRSQLNGSKIVSIVLKNIDNQDNILSFHSRENTTNQPLLTVLGTSTGSTNSIALDPLADASVRDGAYSGKNYGDDTSFLVKSSPNSGFSREAYLKFSLSGVPKVGKAKLRIYGRSVSGNSSVTVGCYAVNDDSWTEPGITWSTAPVSLTTVLGSVLVTNSQQYYEIDVTSFVRSQLSGDKVVSFVLKDVGTSDKILEFHSRENPQDRPQLLILTDSVGGSTGPTTVNTVADASVRDGSYATKNYGSDGSLLVKGSPNGGFTRMTYLRFPLSAVTTVGTAKLRVYGSNTASSTGVTMTAYGLDNDSWSENTITWSTAPASQGTSQGQVTVTDKLQYYEIDVTNYVKSQASGDKIASLVLKDAGNTDKILEFNSKENGQNPPQLMISDGTQALTTYAGVTEIIDNSQNILPGVYPNPFSSNLFLSLPATLEGKYTIQLFNNSGQVVFTTQGDNSGNKGMLKLNFPDQLSRGVYFLKIAAKRISWQYKVVKGY